MPKDFDGWNNRKKNLHSRENYPRFNTGDVRWCSIGVNVGNEQDGKNRPANRPVLIIRKFNHNLFYGVPLTTQNKNNPFYFQFEFEGRRVSAMTSQMRALDARRLGRRLGTVGNETLEEIAKAIKETF